MEGKIGQLVPIGMFHLANQSISSRQYDALCGSLERGVQIYLSGEYNSRFAPSKTGGGPRFSGDGCTTSCAEGRVLGRTGLCTRSRF